MEIAIGSENPVKVGAVRNVFTEAEVLEINASSFVRNQPLSDTETRTGAINRAKEGLKASSSEIGIGLEGGVMYVDDNIYLCNWGALMTRNNQLVTASGARILLPKIIEQELNQDRELGDIMDDYTEKRNVRNKEGAIGIFTNQHLSRQMMFVQVIQLLRGQWEYGMSI